jgi:acetoin utilization deacetylase AcuC-like enzyme
MERETILLYFDPVFQKHDTGQHPENAARLLPTIRYLNTLSMDASHHRPNWEPVTRERLLNVHTAQYVDKLRSFAVAGGGFLDQDTFVCPQSFDVALMAAGAVCDAVERIDRKENKSAFCLVRPPGHHAATDHAAGFCLFNNVAIGARLATKELGYERVLIVDWDVHHGDGTQAIFWEDPKVAYFSMHRDSFYPFTGAQTETGAGAGKGTTRNVPIKYGTAPENQINLFEDKLSSFAETIKPQLVLISAGFDAHKDDPIGSLDLTAIDFAELTRSVVAIANRYADGKIVSVLEGGYQPDALADCIEQHLAELVR